MNTETADTTNLQSTTNAPIGLNGSSGTENPVHRVAQKAHEAVDTVEQAINTSSERVMDWHQEYGEMAREQVRANPLAWIAGAFAVGYVLAKITR